MKKNIIIGLVFLILLSSFVSSIDSQSVYFNAGNYYDGSNFTSFTGGISDGDNSFTIAVCIKISITATNRGIYGPDTSGEKWKGRSEIQATNNLYSYSSGADSGPVYNVGDISGQTKCYLTTQNGSNSKNLWFDGVSVTNYTSANLAEYDNSRYLGRTYDPNYFIGNIYNYTEWDFTLNNAEVYNWFECQNSATCLVNFTISARDNASSQPILNFTANVSGTIYNTLTGTITTTINDSQLVNITVSSNNYFNTTYLNYNTSNNLEAELNPETLEDFILITPNISTTNNTTFNITYTEAVSPTSKAVNYTISSYFPNGSIKESFSTLNIFYNLNITNYNSGIYTIEVNATENVTDVSYAHNSTLKIDFSNIVTFLDKTSAAPLQNKNVTITYPNSNILELLTNSQGSVNFSSFNNDILQLGEYNFTYDGDQGFVTPITVTQEINFEDTPFNLTYNISRANLTILVKDTETNALVTTNVTVSITGIGEFEIETGNLTLENQSFVSGTYTVYVSSDDYTFNQKDFTFTNQEVLEVSIFVTNLTTPNLGTILVTVYDSYLDIVSGGDLRLQILEPSSGSFIEEAQRTSSSSGQATFNILINENSYRIQATATVGGVTYTGFSIDRGETFFEDGQIVNVYLNTVIDIDESQYEGLNITVTNTTLVNNVSFHQVDFIDANGLDHEVCLRYSFLNGIIKTSYLLNCTTGASGTIHEVGGNLLDRNYTWIVDAYVKEGNYKRYYYTETYKSSNNFGTIFQFIVKWLMASLLLIALAMAVHLDRIDYFVYLSIGLSILWLLVVPSYMSATMVGLTILLGLMVGDLAKNKSSVEGD